MRPSLGSRIEANRDLIHNASSLVATTAVTSCLGFVYWWLAARQFPLAAVGFASAIIAAMMILGNIGMLGLGTLLIGELPRQPRKAGSLIFTSLLLAATASGGLAILFVLIMPNLSAEFKPLARGIESLLLFALGVMLTGIGLVLDQALIGMFRGWLQLLRNTLYAILKLIALWIAGTWFAGKLGITIYATWVVGNLVSLAVLAGIIMLKGFKVVHQPQWGIIRKLGRATMRHYALNLALQVPGFALPVMVTVLLSATINASFYAAWMIAGFMYVVPNALTTVLYAVGAADPSVLAEKTRFTLRLSCLIGLLGSIFLVVAAHHVLSLFGGEYANQAALSLRILAFGVFPMIVKVHYVAISRANNLLSDAAVLMAGGGALELLLAAMGASLAGLPGLCMGFVAALCIEAIITSPAVYRTAISSEVVYMAPVE